MKSLFDQFLRLWNQFTTAQRVTISLAAFGVVAGMIALVAWSQRPSMQLLYGRLGEKEAAEVVASLEAQGVKYQIGPTGNSIYVPSDRVHRIRMDLAAKGIPGGEGVGFEIFDRSNFGISDFVQRTNFIRALQGELARTISQVNGVRSARVMVVIPENRLLLKGPDSRPTASVFVEVGSALPSDAVNSIRSLVANAVEGLHMDDVAVIDNKGNVLSDELKSDPLLGSASSQIKFRKHVEDYLSGKIETMLSKVLGPGKAVVRVSAEIDTAAMTTVEEKFDPEGQVPRSETTTEDTSITSERTPGLKPAGVGSNIPGDSDPNSGSNPQKSSEDNRKNKTEVYEINKVTTNLQKGPGAIRRLTAAVFLAQREKSSPNDAVPPARSAAEIDSLRQMVVNALGIQAATPEEMSKIVSLQEVAFEPTATDVTPTPERIMRYVEVVRPLLTVLLAGGIFLFFVWMLKRTKATEGRFELLDPANNNKLLTNSDSRRIGQQSVSPEILNQLIKQKPDNVAAALSGWLAQKEGKES